MRTALVFLLLLSTAALGASEKEIRDSVRDALAERHPTVTPEWWRSLGAEAPNVIIAMFREAGSTKDRVRLLQALGNYPDDKGAVDFLKEQSEKTEHNALRNTALRAVGVSQGAKETEFLSKFLKHSDPQTRFVAAEALKKSSDPKATQALEEHLKVEKQPWFAEKLAKVQPSPLATAVSAERVNASIAGDWSGFSVVSAGKKAGMTSTETSAKLRVNGNQVSGFVERKGTPSRTLKIVNASGKDDTFVGDLTENSESVRFEAQILPSPQGFILQLWIPDQSGFFILRRR